MNYTTPDNITFPTKRTTYNFDGVSPENITIETKNNDSSYGEIIYFYDGFANPVQIKTRFNPNVQITQNYLYDNKFRIIEEQALLLRHILNCLIQLQIALICAIIMIHWIE